MPRWSKTLRHVAPDGSVTTGIVCGRSPRRYCSVPGCRGSGEFQCDFPLQRSTDWKRGRRRSTCDRYLCRSHATKVGPDRDYCPPHVRETEQRAAAAPGAVAPARAEPSRADVPAQLPLVFDPPIPCVVCGKPLAPGELARRLALRSDRSGRADYLPGLVHESCP